MKINLDSLSNGFKEMCETAKNPEKVELTFDFIKKFKQSEYLEINSFKHKISPVFILAYQGEDKAVDFLLQRCGVSVLDAIKGYALAGEIKEKYFTTPYPSINSTHVQIIALFLLAGRNFYQLFSFFQQKLPEKYIPFYVGSIATELAISGITQNSQRLLKFMISCIPYDNSHLNLLNKISMRLIENNMVPVDSKDTPRYDPNFLLNSATKFVAQNSFYGHRMISWPLLYVWIWQGPRLRQIRPILPMTLFVHIASFLCVDNDAKFLKTQPFVKTKQLFLSSLRSITESKSEHKGDLTQELRVIKQKRSAKRLIHIFSPIDNVELFRTKLKDENKKSKRDQKEMENRTILLFDKKPVSQEKIDHPSIAAISKRCRRRISRM